MTYHLSWLGTLIVCVVAIAIGIVSSRLLKGRMLMTLWAVVVSVVFVAASGTAVIAEYSWMATDRWRLVAQAVAICAALAGMTYAIRAED